MFGETHHGRAGMERREDVCRVLALVEGVGLGNWGLRLGAWGLGIGAWGLGLGAWGLGLRC